MDLVKWTKIMIDTHYKKINQLTVLNSIFMSVCFIYRPHSEAFDTHDG